MVAAVTELGSTASGKRTFKNDGSKPLQEKILNYEQHQQRTTYLPPHCLTYYILHTTSLEDTTLRYQFVSHSMVN